MECTIRDFIEGCILDSHPMALLGAVVATLAVCGLLYCCFRLLTNNE